MMPKDNTLYSHFANIFDFKIIKSFSKNKLGRQGYGIMSLEKII